MRSAFGSPRCGKSPARAFGILTARILRATTTSAAALGAAAGTTATASRTAQAASNEAGRAARRASMTLLVDGNAGRHGNGASRAGTGLWPNRLPVGGSPTAKREVAADGC